MTEKSKGKKLSDAELKKLSPEGREFIEFCRDLTNKLNQGVAAQGTWVGCSFNHGEYRPKKKASSLQCGF